MRQNVAFLFLFIFSLHHQVKDDYLHTFNPFHTVFYIFLSLCLCLFVESPITEYHEPGYLNNSDIFLHSLESQESKI